jgi:hypothetical protein
MRMTDIPHLPAPSCSLAAHRYMQRLPWVMFVVLLAVLSGVSAALVTVVYVLPRAELVPAFSVLDRDRGTSFDTLSLNTERYVRDRRMAVYAAKHATGSFVAQDDFVGYAYMLSSDGWAVIPKILDANVAYIGFDTLGTTTTVSRVIADTHAGVSFVRLGESGYRVLPLSRADDMVEGDTVYSGSDFSGLSIAFDPDSGGVTTMLAGAMPVLGTENTADVFVLADGAIYGAVNADGRILSARMLRYALQHVLVGTPSAYSRIGVSCEQVDGFIAAQGGSALVYTDGCAVVPPSLYGFKRDDVMLSVNGVPWSRRAAEEWLIADTVSVQVYRAGSRVLVPVR